MLFDSAVTREVRERVSESFKRKFSVDNFREVHGGVTWSVFIDNLSRQVRRSDLWVRFSHYGKVIKVFIPLFNNRPKYKVNTFAFVHFGSKEDLCHAVEKMNNVMINGRRISVSVSKYKKPSGLRRQTDGGMREQIVLVLEGKRLKDCRLQLEG
ncbi:probable splicing factor, arginine/serine-rich 4 [Hibiscus syriacus]|uniref:probable splicing factor, arginine/serine-rich 4 n=1 Tax=Hibiscus syriacus TaxID=106335 RepID=UPI0019207F05|nr:probable splicing factor, arginine/serine-rich 4 [Hibiscus syriacus]